MESNAKEAMTEMLISYNELNGDIDELHQEPSPLDFMRYVSKNRPFVLRDGCSTWPAVRKWNDRYLREVLGRTPVRIATTPYGNADAAAIDPDSGVTNFVKPSERSEPFNEFLDYLQEQSRSDVGTVIKYSQAQNDNLRDEYAFLYEGDVERDVRWASLALGRKPDAINLWIGNSLSTTALHRDNYENIYFQITGSKDFVLLPPLATACINEQFLPSATFDSTMKIIPDEPPSHVPCAIWDPDRPDENITEFSHLAQPIRVRLKPGDALFLPALWYHKVSQRNDEDGICCSVNYWYDMDFEGGFYSSNAFIRKIAWAATGAKEP